MKNSEASSDLFLDEKSYEHILSQTQDIVFEWDYITKKIYHTDIFEKKFGCSPNYEDFPDSKIASQLVHPEDMAAFYRAYNGYNEGVSSLVGEFRIKDVTGNYEWYRSSSTAMTDNDGRIVKVLGILSNIDAQKKETIFATNLAMRDGLTGLYNRMATENLISQYVQNSTANGVMFIIDIDNFKSINDTMGHQFGDGVLVSTAKSLLTLFRSGDIIGRLGGDEFIVFMTNIGETYNVKRRAKDLITTISTPFQNKSDYPLDISGSVGVALFPQNGSNFDELYKNADIALYRSKSYGKNRYTLFDEKFLENYSQTGIITDIERNAALSKKENEIIGETDNIIYIRDASNHRMMYINDGAKLAYGLSDSDLGKPCYYAFHRRSSACDGCHIEKLKFDEFLVRESYNAELKKNFLVREKLIIWKGITAQILFATDITPQVTQRNEAILQNQLKQQLIETIEEISSSASLEEGIKRALNAMRQLYNGNGIILMSQPKPDNLSVEGTLSVLVDGKDFLFNFKQNVTEEFYQLISTCIKAHTETAVIDVPSFDCLSEQNLEFAHEHKITTALVYLSGLVSPGVIVAVLNPRANLKHLEIFEKVMRFIESQLQRQVLSEKVSAERKRYRTLISSISDSVFEYDVAEDDLTVYINDYKSYGMPDGMMIFKNASEYEKSSLDGSDLIGDAIYGKLHSAFLGISDEPFEFNTTTLNGNELWLRIKPQKVYDSLGVLVRVVGTLKDVTESHLNSEISELNNLKVELEYRKGHDNLTGLHNKHRFYETVQYLLRENPSTDFAIVRFDISGFKVINELFGMEAGDNLLVYIANVIRSTLGAIQNVAFARFEADIFYACVPYETSSLKSYRQALECAANSYPLDFKIIFSYGIFIVDNPQLPVEIMCDRAAIAQSTIKSNYVKRFATYDTLLKDKLLSEQQIVNDMTDSLDNGEFKVFYQPKVDLASGKTVGAEALVRWFHPRKGMISPGDFIPIFEKNGFIMKLDTYVWDSVAKQLRIWIDKGMKLIPVSVNVSRIDMYNPQLCESLLALCKKYDLPPNLLDLEITESSYTNTTVNLVEITKKLTFAGFTVMMDDFGSGYSSLNMLKDVPVDILKVDLNFLSDRETTGKGASILSSIVRMARWLKMPVIAEGVETREQADFLRSIGCEMAQGFYFARPMSTEDYENYLSLQEKTIRESDYLSPSFKLDLDEIWGANAQVNLLFNTLVSGVAVVEYNTSLKKFEHLRVNDGYYELFGFTDENQHTAISRDGFDWIFPQDHNAVLDMFMCGVKSKNTARAQYRRYRADKSIIWIEANLKYIADDGERFVFYSAMNDITKEKQAEIILQAHRERYQLLAQYTAAITFEFDMKTDVFEHNFSSGLVDSAINIKRLKEIILHTSIVRSDYKKICIDCINSISTLHGKNSLRVVMCLDGVYRPYLITFFSIEDENDVTIRIVGIVMAENEFGISDHNEALTLLRSVSEIFPGAISRIEIKNGCFNLIYASEGFYNMYGYTLEEFKNFYLPAENALPQWHSELEAARAIMGKAIKERQTSVVLDENVVCKNNTVKRIHSTRVITYCEDDVIIVTGLDTEV